jgi:hypothetical protein
MTKVKSTSVIDELSGLSLSLLGPDDFDLDRKGRMKKLAKDLSPEMQKHIDRWLDELDESELQDRLSDLVSPEDAQRLMLEARRRRRKGRPDDRLLE